MKTNNLDLCGYIIRNPRITSNKDRATCIIGTTRGNREVGNRERQCRWDCIVIRTKDDAIIQKIDELQQYDVVRIKAVLVTKYAPKISKCPMCGREHSDLSLVVYAEPIYIEKLAHFDNDEEARDFVYDRKEISNQLRIIGDICNEPEKIKNFKSTITTCQYQIAIPRTYRLKGSNDDEKTDFPWVKSYGKNAKEDLIRLQKGSTVLIDGCLQARKQIKQIKCECGEEYSYEDSALEVVPYETEYLKNYKTDEILGISKIED